MNPIFEFTFWYISKCNYSYKPKPTSHIKMLSLYNAPTQSCSAFFLLYKCLNLFYFILFSEITWFCQEFLYSVKPALQLVLAFTGTRTDPQSYSRGVEGASLHFHSTTCSVGSFWLVHSRVRPLCQGGNASGDSGKRKREALGQL